MFRSCFPISQPRGRTDVSQSARGEPESLSKNKQPSFNFRVGKALHTILASHPRRQASCLEELKDSPQATCPTFGYGPWKPHSIFKSHFKSEVEPQ